MTCGLQDIPGAMDPQRISCVANGLGSIPKAVALLSEALSITSDQELVSELGTIPDTLNQLFCEFWDTLRKVKEELRAFHRLWTLKESHPRGQVCLEAFGRLQAIKFRFSQLLDRADDCWNTYFELFESVEEACCEIDLHIKELEFESCVLQQDALFLAKRLQSRVTDTDNTFISVNFTGFALWHDVELILKSVAELLCLEDVLRAVSVIQGQKYVSYGHLSVLDNIVRSNTLFKSFCSDLLYINETSSKDSYDDGELFYKWTSSSDDLDFPRTEFYSEVLLWSVQGIKLCDAILKSVRDEDFLEYRSDRITARVLEIKKSANEFRTNIQGFLSRQLEILSQRSKRGPAENVHATVSAQVSNIFEDYLQPKPENHSAIVSTEEIFRERKLKVSSHLGVNLELSEFKRQQKPLRRCRERLQRVLVLIDKSRQHFSAMLNIIDCMPMMELPPPVPAKGLDTEESKPLIYELNKDQMDPRAPPPLPTKSAEKTNPLTYELPKDQTDPRVPPPLPAKSAEKTNPLTYELLKDQTDPRVVPPPLPTKGGEKTDHQTYDLVNSCVTPPLPTKGAEKSKPQAYEFNEDKMDSCVPPLLPAKVADKTKHLTYELTDDQMESHVKPTQELCKIVCDILEEYILDKLMFVWMRMWMFPENDMTAIFDRDQTSKDSHRSPGLENIKETCSEIQKAVVCTAEEIKGRMSDKRSRRTSILDVWGVSLRHVEKNRCRLVFDSDYDMVKSNRKVVRYSVDLK